MKYFLVTKNEDYADEFDVEGFSIFEGESKQDILNQLTPSEDVSFPTERYFGTNEAIQYDDLKDYLESFEFKELTKEEYDTINKLFGGEFGTFLTLEN